MVIEKLSDVVVNFKVSWLNTGFLTASVPLMEQFFPVITQVCLVFSLQLISMGVDYVRVKYKLKPRKKEDLDLPERKNDDQVL